MASAKSVSPLESDQPEPNRAEEFVIPNADEILLLVDACGSPVGVKVLLSDSVSHNEITGAYVNVLGLDRTITCEPGSNRRTVVITCTHPCISKSWKSLFNVVHESPVKIKIGQDDRVRLIEARKGPASCLICTKVS